LQQSIRTTRRWKVAIQHKPYLVTIFLSDSLTSSCLLAKKTWGKPDHRKSCSVSHHHGVGKIVCPKILWDEWSIICYKIWTICFEAPLRNLKKIWKIHTEIWNEKSRVHC
jgi:hypothetical protein